MPLFARLRGVSGYVDILVQNPALDTIRSAAPGKFLDITATQSYRLHSSAQSPSSAVGLFASGSTLQVTPSFAQSLQDN